MNIPEDIDITNMGGDGTNTEEGVSWRLHIELDPASPQDCVGVYVKGMSMPNVSASGVLHTHSTSKKIACTGSPILDQMTLVKMGKKNSFADIVRS